MESLMTYMAAFGLAAGAGAKAVIPVLALGAFSYTPYFELSQRFAWIADPPVMIVLGVLVFVEIANHACDTVIVIHGRILHLACPAPTRFLRPSSTSNPCSKHEVIEASRACFAIFPSSRNVAMPAAHYRVPTTPISAAEAHGCPLTSDRIRTRTYRPLIGASQFAACTVFCLVNVVLKIGSPKESGESLMENSVSANAPFQPPS